MRLLARFITLLIIIPLLIRAGASMQAASGDLILFEWNDTLYAQGIDSRPLITVQQHRDHAVLPLDGYASPPDGYGFYQGMWNADQTRFAYTLIREGGAAYQVGILEDGAALTLIADELSAERGYLVPVGWAEDGRIILLERFMLHNLAEVRLWQFAPADQSLTLRQVIPIPFLSGNSAVLANGRVFLGFNTARSTGYLLDWSTGQVTVFPTGFSLQDPPASVFETYPVRVIGVVDAAALQTWITEPVAVTAEPSGSERARTSPFLYWMLPDHARSITCYPDSEWTHLRFDLECAGLTVPRAYDGHEGTDIGGRPDGLPPGTPVYAAAPGVVVKQLTGCESADIVCGDAYGNHVLLEHSRVVEGEIQTWFTGYAHLRDVLVETHTYVHEIGIPIALSGDTGLGGAHLHFEVRSPALAASDNWIDPWDTRLTSTGTGLWMGSIEHPQAAVSAFPPPIQQVCQSIDGNNLRAGPGTDYQIVAQSLAGVEYEVFQTQTVIGGSAPGDWHQVRWAGSDITGWMWADLFTACTPVTAG